MRLAAVADLHFTRTSRGKMRELFERARGEADVLALCGDLTDYGLPEEAHLLVEELEAADGMPVVAVLGNHDFESGHGEEVHQILAEAGVLVLDGDACEIEGVGFAGAKGFAGGFGRRALEPWGEKIIKDFVQEAVDETLKLESALARLRRVEHKVALLHYAPIEATVVGEPLEIYAFLGSSRLAEPLGRYPVAAVFHGHAHRGAPEGATENGIPVYNVSLPLFEGRELPFRVYEIG